MSEDVNMDQGIEEVAVKETSQEPTSQGVKSVSDSIPYARFSEVNSRMKEAEAELESFKTKADSKRKAQLEKQGEYKSLLQETEKELADVKEKASAWESYEAQKREQLLKAVELTDRQQRIAGKLDLVELESYVADLTNQTSNVVVTDHSIPSTMATPNLGKNPFKSMNNDEVAENWDQIVGKYTAKGIGKNRD
jgi:alanyl-tRNA synthetase